MASEEAKFAARADRLAGRQGVAGFMPASARAVQPAPTNRYHHAAVRGEDPVMA